MLYAILAEDVPRSFTKRAAARARHVEYLQTLVDAGRVVLAGPLPAIDSPEPGCGPQKSPKAFRITVFCDFDANKSRECRG
jgi:uncharacterized protein YciI